MNKIVNNSLYGLLWEMGLGINLEPLKQKFDPNIDVRFISLVNDDASAHEVIIDWLNINTYNAEEMNKKQTKISTRNSKLSLVEWLIFEYKFTTMFGELLRYESTTTFNYFNSLFEIKYNLAKEIFKFAKNTSTLEEPKVALSRLKIARAYNREVIGIINDINHLPIECDVSLIYRNIINLTLSISRMEQLNIEEIQEAISIVKCFMNSDVPNSIEWLLQLSTAQLMITNDQQEYLDNVTYALDECKRSKIENRYTSIFLNIFEGYIIMTAVERDTHKKNEFIESARNILAQAERYYSDEIEYSALLYLKMQICKVLLENSHLLYKEDSLKYIFGWSLPFVDSDNPNNLILVLKSPIISRLEEIIREDDFSNYDLIKFTIPVIIDLYNMYEDLSIEQMEKIIYLRDQYKERITYQDNITLNEIQLIEMQVRKAITIGDFDDLKRLIEELYSILVTDGRRSYRSLVLILLVKALNTLPYDYILDIKQINLPLFEAVKNRDYDQLYQIAAETIYSDPNFSKVALGGRSGVTKRVASHSMVDIQFSYKHSYNELFNIESERILAIDNYLKINRLDNRFMVNRPIYKLDVDLEGKDSIVSARKFIEGCTYKVYIKTLDKESIVTHLSSIAEYLAHINTIEVTADKSRKNHYNETVLNYLSNVNKDKSKELYGKWFKMIEQYPSFPKRDAHLDNWIHTEDSKILAIDFECKGTVFFGLELAQITEDLFIFDENDWESRKIILESYYSTLKKTIGELEVFKEFNFTKALEAYQIGIATRCLFKLTYSQFTMAEKKSALNMLNYLTENALSDSLKYWTKKIVKEWLISNRKYSDEYSEIEVSDRRRKKISKILSSLLRHTSTDQMDESGWVDIDYLIDKINFSIEKDELLYVVTNIEEERFEYRPGQLRARYGHSSKLDLDNLYDNKCDEGIKLYHGTGYRTLFNMQCNNQDLLPMARHYVHLTNRFQSSFEHAKKRGWNLIFSVISDGESYYSASNNVFLSNFIPKKNLSIESLSSYWEKQVPLKSKDIQNVSKFLGCS